MNVETEEAIGDGKMWIRIINVVEIIILPKSNPETQYYPTLNARVFLHRHREKKLKMCVEAQKTKHSHNDLEQQKIPREMSMNHSSYSTYSTKEQRLVQH